MSQNRRNISNFETALGNGKHLPYRVLELRTLQFPERSQAMRSRIAPVVPAFLVPMMVAPLLTSCNQPGLANSVAAAEKAACPQTLEAVASMDFGLEAALAAKVKAGLSGA